MMQQPVVQPEYQSYSHSCTMRLIVSWASAHFCMERKGSCQLSIQLLSHQNIISY